MGVYLDYNATTPVDYRVLDKMTDVYKNHIGNPDSRTHEYGEEANLLVEIARKQVASLLDIRKDEVFFTSGATESNNIAILGLRDYAIKSNKKHIITTSIEHKAILGATKRLSEEGFEIEYINPDSSGRINGSHLLKRVRPDTLLVSVMHVNNETGIIQPVNEIGKRLNELGVLFHIDATQSCGKLVEEIKVLSYDMMSISGHKMHGPQGVGALILHKKKYRLPPVKPIMYGGNQEHGIRPGTLPTALIVGFGEACRIASLEYQANHDKCCKIQEVLLQALSASGIKYEINGDRKYKNDNTLNISFLGISSEALMLATKQYCSVSNGSACSSSNYSYSHVLAAMGLPLDRIESAIRISWGPEVDLDLVTNDFGKLIMTVKNIIR